jgi:hypothetical protein
MLVQDSQTGYFHEVPDHHVSGYGGYGHVVYDGLGNPVGIGWSPLDLVGKVVNVVKGVASNIPMVRGLVSNLIPGTPAPPAMPYPYPQAQPYPDPQAQPYPYPQTQPYPAPQVPPNMPAEDMANTMSPEGFPYPSGRAWRGWGRRPYWRGHGRYRHWSRGWGRSHGYGHGLWRAGSGRLYSHIPVHRLR